MSAIEKDLELKLRTMRYLWYLGYFVRRNIDLVEYGYGQSRQYTDIDVLGARLDENFNCSFKACDCKSGIRVKTAERLFWLSGVMNYFEATQGLFIRNKMMGAKYIELSKRLNITPISSAQLSDLEKTYGIPPKFYGPFCKEQGSVDQVFSKLKKSDRFVHDYVLKRYWRDQPQQQIVTLIASSGRIKNIKDLEDYEQTFALTYVLSSLSLSVLRLSNMVIMVPNSQKENIIKYELLGGETSFSERRKLLEVFHSFMAREIKERYKEKYPVTKVEFLESLIPEYSKYFVDLVVRFCNNPASSIYVPRLMDLFAFEFALNNRKVSLDDVTPIGISALSLKPLKDFLVFAERSNLTTQNFQQLSKEYLDSLESD